MDLQKRFDKLKKLGLCDRCLGRQFARLGYGLQNYERGAILKESKEIHKNIFSQENIPQDISPKDDCFLCRGFFNKLDKYEKMVIAALTNYEFNNLLIGTRFPQNIKDKEKEIWEVCGDQYIEPIKTEFNRLLGKRVLKRLDVTVEFNNPDITVLVDLTKDKVELQISSVFIYGQYNKYSRNLPQTEWRYKNQYSESIQEIVQAPFVEASKAKEGKFHGAGREDIDVRCFGKREFVLELVAPKKRSIALKKLQKQVNMIQDKVEIFNLDFTVKDKKKELKGKRANKIYRALVVLSEGIEEKDLKKLKQIVGTIKQDTPQRVSHKRAKLTRKREIYKIDYDKLTSKKIDLTIKAEAGAYIKELISGDEGRTRPSVSQILGCEAKCKRLDVLDIEK